MKTAAEIRSTFLEFFEGRGHTVVASSGLVPQNDPTLLFANAGMNQFKGVFLGHEKREYTRAASSQKCVRAGGKHNDLENVGRTARHHTFFEMLGNFSFGDYFKPEAIALAWEFTTGVLGLPPEKLWVTVFEEDDEAESIWKSTAGVLPDQVVRMGEKDNFWSMGDTGPCGPCSEILIDQGPKFSCGKRDCRAGCDCDRYLELWNLVFMQFNRDAQGRQTPLPRPSIDTGMGLERVTAVMQQVNSNYDTDLFAPLIAFAEKISGKTYGRHLEHDTSIRIISDHSRATAFLVADGVLPSNEGRGYVLRRIMRRAARHGKLLGITEPFLHEAVRVVSEQMQTVYPEVQRSIDFVARAVLNEEQTFMVTLETGLRLLGDELAAVRGLDPPVLPGDVAFKLYDTYGFPLDLTTDIAGEQGIRIDQAGFEEAMDQQRIRARRAWKGSGDERVEAAYQSLRQEGIRADFKGYEQTAVSTRIVKILKDGEPVESAGPGDRVELVAPETAFYGESGGQVGDAGTVTGGDFEVLITDTKRPLPDLLVHRGKVSRGRVAVGQSARFEIDQARRRAVANNHTATHILQSVLREVLGGHVKQAGSLVTPERLRFDFTHFEALKASELRQIEDRVNECIRRSSPVQAETMSRQAAIAGGATALFGEKYGEQVRVVSLEGYSRELCGGTHVRSTGEIGLFKIVSEGAVAAGVRRIEAVTGEGACRLVREEEETLARISDMLKTEPAGLADKVERLLAAQKERDKEIERLSNQMLTRQDDAVLDQVREVAGVTVLAARVEIKDPKGLRTYGDRMRDRLGSGILILGAEAGGSAQLLCMVTKDITGRFSAGGIIKEIAPVIGGRGGGRSEMAQAGGKDSGKIAEALEKAVAVIKRMAG